MKNKEYEVSSIAFPMCSKCNTMKCEECKVFLRLENTSRLLLVENVSLLTHQEGTFKLRKRINNVWVKVCLQREIAEPMSLSNA